jgi:uncharacterized membrane protein
VDKPLPAPPPKVPPCWRDQVEPRKEERYVNAAHIHLLLNHLPLLGTGFGVLLLLLAFARRSDELKRVSLGVFALAALIAVPTYLTGEPAENVVERLPGVSKPIIEEHEEAAEGAAAALGVLGVFSLAGLVRFRRSALPNWLAVSSLVLGLVVAGLMARSANLGGLIRHSEIRSPNGVTMPEAGRD